MGHWATIHYAFIRVWAIRVPGSKPKGGFGVKGVGVFWGLRSSINCSKICYEGFKFFLDQDLL